jgi:hypothetical protein
MAKYLLVYEGGSMPETEAEQAAVMQAWETWFSDLGEAVADPGNPFTATAKTIAADGSVGTAQAAASGYSILEADSLDHAETLAKGCPVLHGGAGITIYETFDVM